MSQKLSPLDRRILDKLQQDIPFSERPWCTIASDLHIEELLLLERIKYLKENGIIRRISATFNPRKIGFSSTLVALKVAAKNIGSVAQRLNSYPEVTHNYKRNADYNLWFTLVARNRKRIIRIVKQLKKQKDIKEVLELPATRVFKINVNFSAHR